MTMVCVLTAVLHVFPVTRLNAVLRCLCRYYGRFAHCFFLCFTKAGKISPRLRYFLEYTVGFYIFVKLEEISPKGLNNGKYRPRL